MKKVFMTAISSISIFEDYQYRALTDPDRFYAYIEERITDDEKFYLLFDEIQNVKDFELVVNSFRAVHNVSIFITSFNSKRCWIFCSMRSCYSKLT